MKQNNKKIFTIKQLFGKKTNTFDSMAACSLIILLQPSQHNMSYGIGRAQVSGQTALSVGATAVRNFHGYNVSRTEQHAPRSKLVSSLYD